MRRFLQLVLRQSPIPILALRATYLQVAHSVETLFHLAGETRLAESVRTSARRRERMARKRWRRRAVETAVRAPRRAIVPLRSAVVSLAGWLGRSQQAAERRSPDFAVPRGRPAAGNC